MKILTYQLAHGIQAERSIKKQKSHPSSTFWHQN